MGGSPGEGKRALDIKSEDSDAVFALVSGLARMNLGIEFSASALGVIISQMETEVSCLVSLPGWS